MNEVTVLLPDRLDNRLPGRKIALWLFGVLVFLKAAIAGNSIFNGYTVATSADGIPLDTYAPDAAGAVVSFLAVWGLAQLVICVICGIALFRYRAMVPLLFAILLLEHLGRRLIFLLMPIARTGTQPASLINLALLTLMVAGLVLSLWPGRDRQAEH